MRLIRRRPEGEPGFDPTDREPLWRPSECLSIVDGDTRDALVEIFDRMTDRSRELRDYRDGVLHLSGTRISYVRPADLLTGLAEDQLGVLQLDITGEFAPATVRNMRFMICGSRLAELGKEDWACLLEGEFGGWPLPGKFFDPKPLLPDAVAHAERAMLFHETMKEVLLTGEPGGGELQFSVE
jgi:hypothetical protein